MLPCATPVVATRPRHILLTGVTGFVGQALLERILSTTQARVTVLIRGRGDVNAQQRLERLLDKPVFTCWRRRVGETAARRDIARRVHLLVGDLGEVPALPDDLDLVLHSASCVSFDEPLDRALGSNVTGAAGLYRALGECSRRPHVIHVSTAYVSTGRTDVAYENSLAHSVQWRAEVRHAEQARAAVQARVDSDDLDQAQATANLRSLGRERAHEHGWTDVYTMSKALGERVAEELWAGVGAPLTVLRPTIIESAVQSPFPGWIDGYKVADPLMASYGRGELTDFPGDPATVFDIVPVDVVVSAAMAAAALPPAAGQTRYLHVGTGTSNPLCLGALRELVQDFFEASPWVSRTGEVVTPPRWDFSDPQRLAHRLRRRRHALSACELVLQGLPTSIGARARGNVAAGRRRLTTVTRFIGLYQPYTTTRTVFDDRQSRSLAREAAHAGILHGFGLDLTALDWQHYLTRIHLPALVELMKGRRLSPPATAVDGPVAAVRPHRDGHHRHVAPASHRAPLVDAGDTTRASA